MKVLLCSVGSRGDVQPMLVLARELASRGHQVQIAAPPNFRSWIEREGVSFWSIGADTQQIIADNERLSGRNPVLVLPGQLALLRRETARQVAELLARSEPVDLVVGAGLAFGARLYAERHARAYAYVCYTLSGIRSQTLSPAALPLFGLPAWGNRLLWTLVSRMFDVTLGDIFIRAYQQQGMSHHGSYWRSVHAGLTVLAQDEVMGSLPADAWGVQLHVPALVPLRSEASLPETLERRLGDGTWVYLGFGSMPGAEGVEELRAAAKLHAFTGARICLYRAKAEHGEALAPGVYAVGPIDHTQLFPRMSLVVHHGGAGTTATALRAGVPQWIVPHIVDQFFHGRRIHEIGAGPAPLSKARFSAAALREAFLERERFAARAREIGQALQASNGAVATADFLERLLSTRSPGVAPSTTCHALSRHARV